MRSGIDWTPQRYTRFSKTYDLLFRLFPIGEKARRAVLDGLAARSSILDVACGTGTLLSAAQAAGLRCFGLDYSEGMIRRAASKVPDGDFVLADFYRIPYPDDAFDYVVQTNALSVVATKAAVTNALAEMVRVCKPGGQVRIGDYAAPPVVTPGTRRVERMMRRFGDYPHHYAAILEQMGCYVTYEALGWHGMYQYINARCSR